MGDDLFLQSRDWTQQSKASATVVLADPPDVQIAEFTVNPFDGTLAKNHSHHVSELPVIQHRIAAMVFAKILCLIEDIPSILFY